MATCSWPHSYASPNTYSVIIPIVRSQLPLAEAIALSETSWDANQRYVCLPRVSAGRIDRHRGSRDVVHLSRFGHRFCVARRAKLRVRSSAWQYGHLRVARRRLPARPLGEHITGRYPTRWDTAPSFSAGLHLPRSDRSVPSRLGYDLSTLNNVTEPRAQQVVSGGFFFSPVSAGTVQKHAP